MDEDDEFTFEAETEERAIEMAQAFLEILTGGPVEIEVDHNETVH